MSECIKNHSMISLSRKIFQYYSRIGLMLTTAVLLSGAVIIYFNNILYNKVIFEVYSSIELIMMTLMPYMISAVIASITAMGVMSILPIVRSRKPAQVIQLRLQKLGEGDFTNVSRIECTNDYFKDIAYELNYSIGSLNHLMAQIKIINRQQWDLLQYIRQASMKNDSQTALYYIEKMEENWKMTAEIEEKLKT